MIDKVIIGDATLYQGDCLAILPILDEVDALITDPPYSSGGLTHSERAQPPSRKYQSSNVRKRHPEFTGDNRDQRSFLIWASLWLSLCLDKARGGAAVVLFSDWRQLPTMTDALQVGGWVWRGIVPWDKGNARPQPGKFRAQCEYAIWGTNGPRCSSFKGASYHPGILHGAPPKQREHVAQKPVGVMATLCEIAPVGGLILDPFMGSGTTGIAALGAGRRFIGIEKDRRIFQGACRRIEERASRDRPR